jgi:AraC-like DNA-binding protein
VARSLSESPVRIELRFPAALPGVEVARFSSDERLFHSVKDRLATLQATSGHCEWWARHRVWTTDPGSIQIKLPGEVHRDLRRDGPTRFDVVLFDSAIVESARLALERPGESPHTLSLDSASPAGAPIARLHMLLRDLSSEPLALQCALTDALSALLGAPGSPPAPVRRPRGAPVRRALELIDERFTASMTLDELSDHARLDKFRLCRVFHAEVGLPPYAYVTQRRIARARTMLAAGIAPSEVATSVGLYDQSQLNRHFKRIMGVTPGQYASAVGGRLLRGVADAGEATLARPARRG